MKLQDNKYRKKTHLHMLISTETFKCQMHREKVFMVFVSLFRVFRHTREFLLIWRRHGEGLQILTYARHLWPLSSEGSIPTSTRGIHL